MGDVNGLGESFRGAVFEFRRWRQLAPNWTHDHCQVCQAQIREHPVPEDYSEGYVTYTPIDYPPEPFSASGYTFIPAPSEPEGAATWICPKCFVKYKAQFAWRVK